MLWWALRQMRSKDTSTRKRAAEKLGLSKDARAVQPLMAALKDQDKQVRKAAADALYWIGAPESQQAIADYQVAEELRELENIRQRKDSLICSLADDKVEVRSRAVDDLAKLRDPDLIQPLYELMQVESFRILQRTIAFFKYSDPRAERLIKAGVRRKAADALGMIGPAAVPTLIAALRNRDERFLMVREEAARVLGEIKAMDAVPALIETVLRDEHKTLRGIAERALENINGPEEVEIRRAAEERKLKRESQREETSQYAEEKSTEDLSTQSFFAGLDAMSKDEPDLIHYYNCDEIQQVSEMAPGPERVSRFKDLYTRYPDSGNVCLFYAQALAEADHKAEAISVAKTGINTVKSKSPVARFLGESYLQDGNFGECVRWCIRAAVFESLHSSSLQFIFLKLAHLYSAVGIIRRRSDFEWIAQFLASKFGASIDITDDARQQILAIARSQCDQATEGILERAAVRYKWRFSDRTEGNKNYTLILDGTYDYLFKR